MKFKVQSSKKNSDERINRIKLYSVGAVILLIAILILANFLFDKLLGSALTFDFSDSLQNSISQESIDYIDSLPADSKIQIVGLFDRPGNVSGTAYQYIIPLLDDYEKNSKGKITVDYIDPNLHPDILSQLDPSNSYDLNSHLDSFVIKYNDKIKIVDPVSCYTYDSDYLNQGYYYVISNNVEFEFTNSMYILTHGYSCKAYVVTGLEEAGNEYLSMILSAMAIEYNEIAVSENFVVPEDCDLLIINGPNQDISEKMYLSITDYIQKGGKLLVSVDYNLKNVGERFTRLNKLLNQMNINIDPVLISENDPWYQLGGLSVDSTVNPTDGFKDYIDLGSLHSTYARSVRSLDSDGVSFTTYPVLMTSENASTVEIDNAGNAITDTQVNSSRFYVCMLSVGEGNDPAKAFVFSTRNFTSDEYISAYGLNDNNVKFLRSCIRELTSTVNDLSLDIKTKNVDNFSIDKSKATSSSSTAVLVVFMILVPLSLVSIAVIVYSKRKNL